MYKNDPNAIQRARKSAGVTQKKLAEMSGYAVERIKCWKVDTRLAWEQASTLWQQSKKFPLTSSSRRA